jgi:hypothetical protein
MNILHDFFSLRKTIEAFFRIRESQHWALDPIMFLLRSGALLTMAIAIHFKKETVNHQSVQYLCFFVT